jgi:hypothetical protein
LTSPLLAAVAAVAAPLALHPDNPRLFLFRGRPTVLVTSGEHYGAVLNLDFDATAYLDELAACGLNLTRLFSGTYREIPGSFGIKGNTLAPAPGRYLAPWAPSDQPGYRYGGNKYDLTRFNLAYLERLKQFVAAAGQRGIVVEYVLFCPFYTNDLWLADPMHVSNNVNGVGNHRLEEAYNLSHPELQAIQEAFARRVVAELAPFDNVYYEICNEPYFGGVTAAWQARIAEVIAEADRDHPHLIAQNIANASAKVAQPDPRVSIFNFHYASPPYAVAENWGLAKPIAFDETGFAGSEDFTYRRQAWEFMLAGGSVFSNLDYSFTTANAAGRAKPEAPGGGGQAFRRQMRRLLEFLEGFDLVHLRPVAGLVQGPLDRGLHAVAAGDGRAYGVYLRAEEPLAEPVTLSLALGAGRWRVDRLDPADGARAEGGVIEAGSGVTLPPWRQDLVLKLSRVE